jgi:hypothetical protein
MTTHQPHHHPPDHQASPFPSLPSTCIIGSHASAQLQSSSNQGTKSALRSFDFDTTARNQGTCISARILSHLLQATLESFPCYKAKTPRLSKPVPRCCMLHGSHVTRSSPFGRCLVTVSDRLQLGSGAAPITDLASAIEPLRAIPACDPAAEINHGGDQLSHLQLHHSQLRVD